MPQAKRKSQAPAFMTADSLAEALTSRIVLTHGDTCTALAFVESRVALSSGDSALELRSSERAAQRHRLPELIL